MTSRKQIYDKYFNSNIFNQNPNIKDSAPSVRVRVSQPSLANTKDDLFNTEKNHPKESLTKKGVKRLGVYSKIYGSDIFCRTEANEVKKREGVKKIRNANNFSNCMEGMKNNEEFSKNLKTYAQAHRAPKKEYNPDKYLKVENAAERYYKEIYDPHGSTVLPERNFSADPKNKEVYAHKKRHLKKEMTTYNDCGADGKKKPGEHEGFNTDKKIHVKKKNEWSEKNSGGYHFVDSKINPGNNCKINKQIYLQSNLFKDYDNSKQNETNPDVNMNIEKINTRIEQEKAKNDRYERYHIGNENPKRDLTNNDRSLWGAVHTKWEKSNLDWKSPETELMFGTGVSQDVNKNFGPKGPNAFQRKLNQLADTKNKDTISEEKKVPINNLQKPPSNDVVNSAGIEKMEAILKEMPNLKEDKKLKIKMDTTTSLVNGECDWDKKAKTLNKFYTNPNFNHKLKNKNKEIVVKVGQKDKKEKEIGSKSGHDFCDYILSYSTKGQFEKFEEGDIKKMFGNKGIHIYDIQKNMFDKGTYNTIRFKVRENEEEGNLKQKIEEVKKELAEKDFKIQINPEKKKDIRKNTKKFVSNPGAKIGILNENIGVYNNAKHTKIPDKIRKKNSFSKQFVQINYGYKKNK
jgi:hypothetical protein